MQGSLTTQSSRYSCSAAKRLANLNDGRDVNRLIAKMQGNSRIAHANASESQGIWREANKKVGQKTRRLESREGATFLTNVLIGSDGND
jgi:hypothetical protein